VVPGSSRDCVAGWLGEALKIRVKAPPELGKANLAAEKVLAAALGVPRKTVRILVGKSSQHKLVEISSLYEAEINQRLAKFLD